MAGGGQEAVHVGGEKHEAKKMTLGRENREHYRSVQEVRRIDMSHCIIFLGYIINYKLLIFLDKNINY